MSNEPKHTATPWKVVEHNDKNETDIISDEFFIAQAKHYSDDDITFERLVMIESKVKRIKDTNQSIGRANAARIVQCVNACEGMGDPEATIKGMRYELDRFRTGIADSENREIKSFRAENAELIEALRSIIAQWDTPNWKLTESTGTIINQARTTLAKYEKP